MIETLAGTKAWHVEHGEAVVVLKSMPDACVDAVVTDPPAGMSFMGKEWDDFRRSRNPADSGRDNVFGRTSARGPEYGRRDRDNFIAFLTAILAECYRVTKPGGRMLCWSIPRTMHWTGMAIEDAGWSIENVVAHLFGSGFPKAKSQLKPAREDWWLARKPAKAVAPLNIDACRVTVTATDDIHAKNPHTKGGFGHAGASVYGESEGALEYDPTKGRWPANLVLSHAPRCVCVGMKRVVGDNRASEQTSGRRGSGSDETGAPSGSNKPNAAVYGDEEISDWRCVEGCPVAELDRQSGTLKSGSRKAGAYVPIGYIGAAKGEMPEVVSDSGGASRFFNNFQPDADDIDTAHFIYQAKASRVDREVGCDGLHRVHPVAIYGDGMNTDTKVRTEEQRSGRVNRDGVRNNHPTVKSTPLMRHLVKLIAKPGDVVLDPFTGSGSTGRGAVLEGCRFIGIEREDTEAEPYVTIARRRIATVSSQLNDNLDNLLDSLNG